MWHSSSRDERAANTENHRTAKSAGSLVRPVATPTLNGLLLVCAPICRHHRVTHRLLGDDGAQQLAQQDGWQATEASGNGRVGLVCLCSCWGSCGDASSNRWGLCCFADGRQRVGGSSEGGFLGP